MMKPLIAMLKNNLGQNRAIFEEIEEAIALAPTLINPNFDKDFIFYTLGSDSSISAILTKLNGENTKQPLVFFSEGLV